MLSIHSWGYILVGDGGKKVVLINLLQLNCEKLMHLYNIPNYLTILYMAEILITKKLITSFNKIITFNNKYFIMKAFQDKKIN